LELEKIWPIYVFLIELTYFVRSSDLTARGVPTLLFLGTLICFVVVALILKKHYVCGEVVLITSVTTLNVVGGKMRLMTHKYNIVLAP
jgi:hypothetical protein